MGAGMILGVMCGCGPEETGNREKKEVSTQMVSQLYKWFKKEYGSVKCRTINGRFRKEVYDDISTQGLAEPDKMARVFAKCDDLSGRVAAKAADMLRDALEAGNK